MAKQVWHFVDQATCSFFFSKIENGILTFQKIENGTLTFQKILKNNLDIGSVVFYKHAKFQLEIPYIPWYCKNNKIGNLK